MLVGRDRECRVLRTCLSESLEGRTRVVALRGEPGIGKTRLLEFAASLDPRFRVVWIQGHESEQEIPFAGLSALAPLVEEVRGDLPDSHVAALEAALDLGSARRGDQVGVAAATLVVLAAVAERTPLLIAADDVHLMDQSSVEVLGFALRRLRTEPVAVVLTARVAPEVPEPVERQLEQAEQVLVSGLSFVAAGELTAERGPLTAAMWAESGGNPLALLEGTSAGNAGFLDEPMQLSVRLLRGYGRKLVGLPARTREAMLVLAVAGEARDVLDGALHAHGLRRADLEPAEELNLVRLGAGTAGFTHPLVRSAVHQSASSAQRRSAHRALVAAYDGHPGSGAVDRRAFHLAAATSEPDDVVSGQIAEAAKAAMGRQSFVTATALYEHAAMLTPPGRQVRPQRMLEAAVAGQAAGDLHSVGRLLDRAVTETADEGLRTAALHLKCRVEMWSGNAAGARDQLIDLADRVEDTFRDWSAAMRAQAAVLTIAIGESRAAVPMAARAVAAAANQPDEQALPVLITQAVTLAINGEAAPARAYLDRARRYLPALDPLSIDQPLLLAALTHASLGEVGTAVEQIEDLVRRARTAQAVGLLPFQMSWLTLLYWMDGRWVDALATGLAAVQSAEETGWSTELPNCLVALATVEGALGRVDDALGHLAVATRCAAGRPGQQFVDAHVARVRGLIALAAGRPADASTALRTAGDYARATGMGDPVLFGWAGNLTEALLRCGERDEARLALAAVEREVERTGRASAAATAARCRALMAESLDDARAEFAVALARHAASADPFEEARTRMCLGEVLNRAKKRAEARVALRAAAAAFRWLGAVEWERRAEDGLRATGLKPRSRSPRPVETLTPKEVQVAVAVADGLSYADVAMRFTVTPRTVEFHLGNVYRKLGIQGTGARAELARIRREHPDLLTGNDG